MANVKVIQEVPKKYNDNGWTLCFQWCEFIYDDGDSEYGYRFIWRRPDGSLQAARGQARIPSLQDMNELIEQAALEGWLGSIEKQSM